MQQNTSTLNLFPNEKITSVNIGVTGTNFDSRNLPHQGMIFFLYSST